MEPYTYLLVNVCTVIVCFIFSFHPKIRFDRYFLPFLKASLLVAVPFILWDAYFTNTGVWWFNGRYLTGVQLLGLPAEEWLFFICIPFSCVFTFYCLDKFFTLAWRPKIEVYVVLVGMLICLVLSAIHFNKIYTLVTFVATGVTLAFLRFGARVDWLGKITTVYAILLVPFLAVNGVLTGTGLEEPIVNYTPGHFMGIRVMTIPVEDAVYGYTLILWNIFFFLKFSKSR